MQKDQGLSQYLERLYPATMHFHGIHSMVFKISKKHVCIKTNAYVEKSFPLGLCLSFTAALG